ncbi:MAG: hypothetical protein Q9183_003102 [Haloplaca sp. 2 TL-2023]
MADWASTDLLDLEPPPRKEVLLEDWEIKDQEIRELPTWSSPLPEIAADEVEFRFQTSTGTNLDFLSLFLHTERQVDIGFPKRHALALFLMNRLEQSHKVYIQSNSPEDAEILEMFSAEEMELGAWGSFIHHWPYKGKGERWLYRTARDSRDRENRVYYWGRKVDFIRQIAVHRSSTAEYNFDTSTIKGAVACAYQFQDDALLQEIELVVRYLYTEELQLRSDGEKHGPEMTAGERVIAYKLLWPLERPIASVAQILTQVESMVKRSSFKFARQRFPSALIDLGCEIPEHLDLEQWRRLLHKQFVTEDGPKESRLNDADKDLMEYLSHSNVKRLRNAAAHRGSLSDFEDTKEAIGAGIRFCRLLGDEDTARSVELKLENFLPVREKKGLDWMEWCKNRDAGKMLRIARGKAAAWKISVLGMTKWDFTAHYNQSSWDAAAVFPIIRLVEHVVERIMDYGREFGMDKLLVQPHNVSLPDESKTDWDLEVLDPEVEAEKVARQEAANAAWADSDTELAPQPVALPWRGDTMEDESGKGADFW